MVLIDNGGRSAREVDILPPPADLVGAIEHLWLAHGPHPSGGDWRVVPDTSPHLIAIVTERARQRELRVILVGARSWAAAIDVEHRVLTAGLRLRPGALPMLTHGSAREFVDRSVSIEDVCPARMLRGLELGADASGSLMLRQLIGFARRARLHRPVPTMPAGVAAPTSVASLASELQTPTRSLRERVHREVGMSPKRMLRVMRLHAALRLARRHRLSWSQIAYATGYADQAHLTREMRALLGEPPSVWAARGSAVSFKTSSANLA